VIQTFKDRETEKIFNEKRSLKLPFEIQSRALRKLILLNVAETEKDLTALSSNRFEHWQEKGKENALSE